MTLFKWGEECVVYIENGGHKNIEDDPIKNHGVKRVSILFTLPYWAVS